MNNLLRWLLLGFISFGNQLLVIAQPVPSKEENIYSLITFSQEADKEYGDDDYKQAFYVIIPQDVRSPFFIRVFDPDIGGKNDENIGGFNSSTKFSVFAGHGVYTDVIKNKIESEMPSGQLKATKTFSNEPQYDNGWYSFGPFNPIEGEFVEELNGNVFKILAEGKQGNDGNIYKYFISSTAFTNNDLEGVNVFTFEYTFRLNEDKSEITHIYPFVTKDVISITLYNFDFDSDGEILIYSRTKIREKVKISADGNWVSSKHYIDEDEKGSCLDVQILKKNNSENNNICFYLTNQYGVVLPFYVSPLGNFNPSMNIIVTK